MSVRTRFAPSPTGSLHVGSLRTALFNWLFARRHGGRFVLRVDDTDQTRHDESAVAPILDGMRWLGLDWDEGPHFQSDRKDLYANALRWLVDAGHVYRDYTTESDRDRMRLKSAQTRSAFRFRQADPTGHPPDAPHGLRFRVPLGGGTMTLKDLIRGDVCGAADDIGDFVVARSDGSPLYSFATVVDELDMGITHVIRAEEHLANTFPQLLLYAALTSPGAPFEGREVPAFAHLPYVAAPGGKKKLSKRDGVAVSLQDYVAQGYVPEAVLNYIARLGWSLDDRTEVISRDQMVENFSLERVVPAPACHDPDRLFHLQSEWMRTKGVPEKFAIARRELLAAGLVHDPMTPWEVNQLTCVVLALGDRFKLAADVVRYGGFFFQDRVDYDPVAVDKRLRSPAAARVLADMAEALSAVDPCRFGCGDLEPLVRTYAESRGLSMGLVVNAVRVAVTGQAVGPGIYETLMLVGKDRCVSRLAEAVEMVSGEAARPAP